MQDKTVTTEAHSDFLERYRLENELATMTEWKTLATALIDSNAKSLDTIEQLTHERDKWREIAERFYNATFEYDQSVMRRVIADYEEMP